MKKVEKVMQEVERVTIFCDLCGKSDGMPRYAQNRICHCCGREVCGNCQGPYSDEEPTLDVDTICIICRSLESEYLPAINATYRRRDELNKEWKDNSLALSSPRPAIEEKK